MAAKKYRPYFTLAELKMLQQALGAFQLVNRSRDNLAKYLNKYISDIEADYRKPNHILKPSIEDNLGFADTPNELSEEELNQAEKALIDKLSSM